MPTRPPVLAAIAQEKKDAFVDLVGRGQVTRPIATIATWDEMQAKGPELLAESQTVIHFPFFAEVRSEGGAEYNVSPRLMKALDEHISGSTCHVVLLPTDRHSVRQPYPKDKVTIEEWTTNPQYAQTRLIAGTKAIISGLLGAFSVEMVPLSLPQKTLSYDGRPYLQHLLRRWVKKHKPRHRLNIEASVSFLPAVRFEDLRGAPYAVKISKGKGVALLLPFDVDHPDGEDVDLLIQLGHTLREVPQLKPSQFGNVDLILDWPEVELERPELGEYSLAPLLPKFRKFKERLNGLTKVKAQEALRDHLENLETALSDVVGTLHIAETWNKATAAQSRDAIIDQFEVELRSAYEEARDALGFIGVPDVTPTQLAVDEAKELSERLKALELAEEGRVLELNEFQWAFLKSETKYELPPEAPEDSSELKALRAKVRDLLQKSLTDPFVWASTRLARLVKEDGDLRPGDHEILKRAREYDDPMRRAARLAAIRDLASSSSVTGIFNLLQADRARRLSRDSENSEAPIPNMNEPESQKTLTAPGRAVVEAIHSHWTQHRTWPKLGRFRVHVKTVLKGNFDEALKALPEWTVIVPPTNQDHDHVRLTIQGLAFCGREALVKAFVELHRIGAAAFIRNPNSDPVVTSDQLRELLPDVSDQEFGPFSEVVYEDYSGGGYGRTSAGGWWKKAGEGSLRYENVHDLAAWLALRDDTGNNLEQIQSKHVALLAEAYKSFCKEGRWPDYLEFIVEQRSLGNMIKLLNEMPPSHFYERAAYGEPAKNRTEFRLTFKGVMASGIADQDLELVAKGIHQMYRHYESAEGDQPVTFSWLTGKAGVESTKIARFRFLIHACHLGVSVVEDAQGPIVRASSMIDRCENVQTVQDLYSLLIPGGNAKEEVLKVPVFGRPPQPQSSAKPPGDPLTGFQLRGVPVRILGRAGTGGSADVYKGVVVRPSDGLPAEGSAVAIKVTQDWLLAPAMIEETKQRVTREGSLKGVDHPHLTKCYGSYEEELSGRIRPYVVLEFLEGITLKDWVRMSRAASLSQFVRFLLPVVDALEFLHSRRIIHRDVKPSNIMIDQGKGLSSIVLMDLGIAHFDDDSDVTGSYRCNGTRRRSAPEFLFRNPPEAADDPAVDVYGLGTVAYDLLTGSEFLGHIKNDAQIAVAVRDWQPAITNTECPRGLVELTLRMLDKKPENRPKLDEVRKALQMHTQSQPAAVVDVEAVDSTSTPPATEGFQKTPSLPVSVRRVSVEDIGSRAANRDIRGYLALDIANPGSVPVFLSKGAYWERATGEPFRIWRDPIDSSWLEDRRLDPGDALTILFDTKMLTPEDIRQPGRAYFVDKLARRYYSDPVELQGLIAKSS